MRGFIGRMGFWRASLRCSGSFGHGALQQFGCLMWSGYNSRQINIGKKVEGHCAFSALGNFHKNRNTMFSLFIGPDPSFTYTYNILIVLIPEYNIKMYISTTCGLYGLSHRPPRHFRLL